MSNNDLCKAFIEGATKGKSNRMEIVGRKIFSYAAVIGRFEANGVLSLNPRKYSQTTSRRQNCLRRAAEQAGIKYEYSDNF